MVIHLIVAMSLIAVVTAAFPVPAFVLFSFAIVIPTAKIVPSYYCKQKVSKVHHLILQDLANRQFDFGFLPSHYVVLYRHLHFLYC